MLVPPPAAGIIAGRPSVHLNSQARRRPAAWDIPHGPMTLSLPAASPGQLPTAPGLEGASLQHSLEQSVKPHPVAKEADSNIQASHFLVHLCAYAYYTTSRASCQN